jgi:L-ascorbate metabolism protein UlaG (beta-lactamase superfamily)
VAKASPNAKFIVTGWSREIMANLDIPDERVIVPPAQETITLAGTSIKLTALPGAHYEKEHDDQKGYRWFGYLIEWNGIRFFHAGDTIIHPGYVEMLKGLPKIDVAMLPINGRDWIREVVVGATGNLLPAEAAYLSREVGWDVLIVGHNDLYPNNTIPFAEITSALEKTVPRQKYKVLQPGELYYYIK